MIQPDGGVRWLEARLAMPRDRGGGPLRVEGIATDVTRLTAAEEALHQAEAIYHSLVESLPLHVLRKDVDGRVVFGNQRHCQSLGAMRQQLIGKTDFDLFPPELAEKYTRDDRQVLETGSVLHEVEEHQTPGGQKTYVEVLKGPVRDRQGRTVGIQVMFWDVTERKQAEAALQYERYLLRTLLDNIPDAIYFKNEQSKFVRISKGLADKFGLHDAWEAIGKSDADFFAAEHASRPESTKSRSCRAAAPC